VRIPARLVAVGSLLVLLVLALPAPSPADAAASSQRPQLLVARDHPAALSATHRVGAVRSAVARLVLLAVVLAVVVGAFGWRRQCVRCTTVGRGSASGPVRRRGPPTLAR